MKNKVFVLPPNEDWIVDRFVKEWNEDNSDISVLNPHESDVIWLLSDWCWKQLPKQLLQTKKVLTTVHHIVPEKFGSREILDFKERDEITSEYHVYNRLTYDFIKNFTKKKIHLIHYWANQKIWKKTANKFDLKKKYGLPDDKFVIGSFQRDTEGKDLISPKLEKGPDLLCDFIESHDKKNKVHVVLAGWRRQYVMSRLEAADIKYSYFERPPQETVNELYQTLDLYPVSARCEGGPQALIECGLLGVPCISRPVGIADQVLPSESINEDLSQAIPNRPNVNSMLLPDGYRKYRNIIESM